METDQNCQISSHCLDLSCKLHSSALKTFTSKGCKLPECQDSWRIEVLQGSPVFMKLNSTCPDQTRGRPGSFPVWFPSDSKWSHWQPGLSSSRGVALTVVH
ncbi:hypothetical protein RRG08_025417 [Elysia crispata]|uniref:Uncharacterized protein n=1 Tax=Elysia crispata TaxID=231223 RepID=A0AAE1DBZ0_9GAST|nr:hypothetical protein RRG08_025417 [Elysia crispata]